MSITLSEKKGFICDMDGVIYHGNRILDGAKDFCKWLMDNDKKFIFLTTFIPYLCFLMPLENLKLLQAL